MGVAGLWEVLKPAAETRSMTELAVTEGFIRNPQGFHGFRIGIDASIWFVHAECGKKGENPVLRTLFFRCATLMRTTFLPLFVFDGPKRPDFKRGKKIDKTSHKLIPGMKAIIEAFGFEWRVAPAEAEAELACLNRAGVIDAVLSDDVDSFLFGAITVIRNISNNLSGNRGNPILNKQGRDDKNHTRLYRESSIRTHSSISLNRGGLILIGLLSGGDYTHAGLPGCGITTAHALARCGFGDSLYEATTTLTPDALPDFLTHWRQDLREELRTNSRGIIGRKLVKLAKKVPNSFPNVDHLLSYVSPITSESLGHPAEKNLWGKEPDVGKLAAICEFYFEWGYREAIIKRFRTLLWHSITLRILRRAIINAEKSNQSDQGSSSATMPFTPHKGKDRAHPRIINTPSKMIAKHFASMGLTSPSSQPHRGADSDDEHLIVKIHSCRNHVSTDGLLEYRLEVAPAQLVQLAESGIKGTRNLLEKEEWASEEEVGGDDDDSDVGKKTRGPKPPPDPRSHLRLWMPACLVAMAEPEIVEEYEERMSKKTAKNKKANSKGEFDTTKQMKRTSKLRRSLYESDTDGQKNIENILAERNATIQTTPSGRANRRKMVIQTMLQGSEDGGSDPLLSMHTLSTQSLPESSRMTIKREKRRKSSFGYLSLSDEGEQHEDIHRSDKLLVPAPFPVSLDEDDVFLSRDANSGSLAKVRPLTNFQGKHSTPQTPDSERHQPPRKSLKRTLIESSVCSTPPPRRIRPAHGAKKATNTTVIEISYDNPLAAVSVQGPIVNAGSGNNVVRSKPGTEPIFRNKTCDVIDLT